MAILTVGPGKQFATLSSAVKASHDGDVIQVQAGTYTNDSAIINTKITIMGVGGMVNLVATVPPPNGKAILVTNTDVTLSNIAFSGVKVADGNGAGIRYQHGNLTINDCYFHDNQDGLLAGADTTGSITINNSEFSHNGTGNGLTHNLYVGEIGTLTVNGSYFHDAVVGHEIKSRALNTIIENSRIFDLSGSASYSIDLPNGGNAVIQNNVIEQGAKSQNPIIIHVGGEAPTYAGTNVRITGNVILNDLHIPSAVAVVNRIAAPVTFANNQVFGLTSSKLVNGAASITGTTFLASEPLLSKSHPWQAVTVPLDRLMLYLAQDTGSANVQFIVSVDGNQLGAAQSVTASQQAGQTQAFSFAGTFGAGSHDVSINYVSGSGSATQQLHVDALYYDGHHYAADTAALTPGRCRAFRRQRVRHHRIRRAVPPASHAGDPGADVEARLTACGSPSWWEAAPASQRSLPAPMRHKPSKAPASHMSCSSPASVSSRHSRSIPGTSVATGLRSASRTSSLDAHSQAGDRGETLPTENHASATAPIFA